MNLEEIFKNNLKELELQIGQFSKKNPNLMQALMGKKNDPHISRMISAFSLISASLEYEVQKKLQRELQSIFLNIYPEDFCTIAPTALLSVTNKTAETLSISANKIIRNGNNIYQTTKNTFINNLEVTKLDFKHYEEKSYLSITFTGQHLKQIKYIDVYCDDQTLNSIFNTTDIQTGKIHNHGLYFSDCKLELLLNQNFRDFITHYNNYGFFRISQLNLLNPDNNFELLVPINQKFDLDQTVLKTNILEVKNNFLTYSSPFVINSEKDNLIPLESNQQIIRIKNLYNIDGVLIPHVTTNLQGWHCNINKYGYNICCSHYGDFTGYVEIECFNTTNNDSYMFFEEYLPCDLKWFDESFLPFTYENIDQINKVIQFIHCNSKDVKVLLSKISDFIKIYNPMIDISFSDIEFMHRIKPQKIGKYNYPTKFTIVSASTNTTNTLLLRHIIHAIKKQSEQLLDFVFSTPNGEVIYE